MIDKTLPLCQTPTEAYIYKYPAAIKFAQEQFSINWPPEEYPVENDIHDILTNFTEFDRHGVMEVTRLFTKYELMIGEEYWAGRIAKKYTQPCIRRMAYGFAHAEMCMHAPFYDGLNKALNLNTEKFYVEYKEDSVLAERIQFIADMIDSEDDLLSLAVFSMMEGAVLYSSFAYLKHFRANGKNKLKNLVSGINASVKDENLHSLGGAWLFRTHLSEVKLTEEETAQLKSNIYEAAKAIYEHECRIIDKIFAKGKSKHISATQLQAFVQSRIDICLGNLGLEVMYKPKYNPISDWFYDSINTLKLHDFFDTSGADYNRNYVEEDFLITW